MNDEQFNWNKKQDDLTVGDSKMRNSARKRLKLMEERGNIAYWDFIPREDLFYITLLTGDEITLQARDIKFFQLGVLAAINQASGVGHTQISNLIRALPTLERGN